MTKEVYIVAATRTALGSFNGSLSAVPAPKFGAAAITGAIKQCGINPAEINEVIMGCVLQA